MKGGTLKDGKGSRQKKDSKYKDPEAEDSYVQLGMNKTVSVAGAQIRSVHSVLWLWGKKMAVTERSELEGESQGQ